jgi:hypothetical protein
LISRVRDLDAPGVGLGVEDLLDVLVELFAAGEHFVQLVGNERSVVWASWPVAA